MFDMRYLLASCLSLMLICCAPYKNFAGFRVLNEEEHALWIMTVDCFVGSGIMPYDRLVYQEPVIQFVPEVDHPKCPRNRDGCALSDGRIYIHNGYEQYPEIARLTTLLIHEYKHWILFQAGIVGSRNIDHKSLWWDKDSPCPDNLHLTARG